MFIKNLQNILVLKVWKFLFINITLYAKMEQQNNISISLFVYT